MRAVLLLAVLASTLLAPRPALSDWRGELKVFRVGIAADGDVADAAARAEPFRLALEGLLRLPVEIFAARDYPALIGAVTDQRVDYAVMSATAYAAAWNLCECVEPLVVVRSADGAAGFSPVVIAPLGGADDLENLRRGRLAVVADNTVGGALLALHDLRRQGFLGDRADAVAVTRFDESEAAIRALGAGSVDAVLGWAPAGTSGKDGKGTMERLSAHGLDPARYQVIWRAPEIPFRVHLVRRTLPVQARNLLRGSLSTLFDDDPVAYDSIEPDFGGGFIPARNALFAPLAQMLAERGIAAVRPPPTGELGQEEGQEGSQEGGPAVAGPPSQDPVAEGPAAD